MKKGHYAGDKHRGTHTTIIPAAEELVRDANRMAEVTGILPDFIHSGTRARQTRVKFKRVPAGLEVTVIGTTSKQTIYIYTAAPELVAQRLGGQLADNT
jgi:hypothetical protein